MMTMIMMMMVVMMMLMTAMDDKNGSAENRNKNVNRSPKNDPTKSDSDKTSESASNQEDPSPPEKPVPDHDCRVTSWHEYIQRMSHICWGEIHVCWDHLAETAYSEAYDLARRSNGHNGGSFWARSDYDDHPCYAFPLMVDGRHQINVDYGVNLRDCGIRRMNCDGVFYGYCLEGL